MNIFVVSPNQKECAQMLDDKRLQKMILESAQMLSAALHRHGGNPPYKLSHKNHPCTLWTGDSRQNYLWHLDLLEQMHTEYIGRRGKSHKSYTDCYVTLKVQAGLIPDGEMTPFANCSLFKDKNVFEAYKMTMVHKWQNDKLVPRWTNCNRPEWSV
jgi:hypothetical protein